MNNKIVRVTPLSINIITGLLINIVFSCGLYAQPVEPWHGVERSIHYRPEGTDFVKVNGSRRFNRALYGSNTGFRVEGGDLPEFALYLPGMGGNFKMGLISSGKSKWITKAGHVRTIYRPGSMIYEIGDSIIGAGSITITVLALSDAEGMIIKAETKNISAGASLLAVYGGVSGRKFSRDGDIGADPESSFYLLPEYCNGNIYEKGSNDFRLTFGSNKQIAGVFPSGISLRVADALFQQTPLQLLSSSAQAASPVLAGLLDIKGNNTYYFLVQQKVEKQPAYNTLAALFLKAEASRKKLAERVVVKTPDKYINTLGGALSMAADAIWEDPSYMHGAVAWRMRLPAWRGAYVADPLGWHDRARRHFSSYALSQVLTPATGPVVADTALHLARQLEKMGTSMFSEGYICRNPGGDIRPHHYDMNLVFVDQLLNHFNWTGDTAYVREMWPLIERHLAWEKRNFDGDGDGLYDAYACIWASDALQYSGGGVTHSSAYNYRANKAAAELAEIIGVNGKVYADESAKILHAVQSQLWLKDKGWFAEYKDVSGLKLVHPAAGIWTIYHAIDSKITNPFTAYQSLRYIDNYIPHIPVQAKGLNENGLQILSTSNWQPYTWSVNNVALAENLHTALAYWQGGRNQPAFDLWKSALTESMYLSASPGGFEQLSFYDAVRGELYRDFADPIGMAGRSLVEGLFGVLPDALHDTLLLKPGFPESWNFASLEIPDISIHFNRTGMTDRYQVRSSFKKRLNLQLQLPAQTDNISSVKVNGKPVSWEIIENVDMPLIKVYAGKEAISNIEIKWKGSTPELKITEANALNNETVKWVTRTAEMTQLYDPQQALKQTVLKPHSLEAVPAETGNHTFFILLKQGQLRWWQPVSVITDGPVEPVEEATPSLAPGEEAVCVDISASFNDKVTNVFKEQYLSPRPAFPTLQLPLQGIGNWCYPLIRPVIDDSGLRKLAGNSNAIKIGPGLSFNTPSDTNANNIVFTSQWDVYPDSIVIPMSGAAREAYFMMAGTTNHMQSQLVNAEVIMTYTDGSFSRLSLINPETWWPVEQDYYEDGYAFHLKQSSPLRVHLKDGKIIRGGDNTQRYTSLKGFSNRAIDGGAATILHLKLDPEKTLKSLTLKALANDVVIGLMSVSLIKK